MSNNNLLIAKKINNDEFYTPYETVEYIVSLYKEEFFGKTVYDKRAESPRSLDRG